MIGCIISAALMSRVDAQGIPHSETSIAVPASWQATDDQSSYPFRIAAVGGEVELLVFRSDLDASHTISNTDELKQSVQRVVDSVILTLPNSKLISNTGYNETKRTGFALEFVSADPENGAFLRHRLMGWLYKHPDGHQILFTLWGRGTLEGFSRYEADIRQMQSAFEFTGPHEAIALSTGAGRWALPALVILMTVAGLLYYRSTRNARTRLHAISESGWQCGCGCYNAPSLHRCRQCGQSRVVARVR
ncbi:hypothetical protein C3F09_12885 [candidate division GN15 bacterium]|uniref:RanBP2-type domain-containing protein n=1 Tax=candidate division GN15 bacterium TaxID=2072418 RepID=A0A855WTA8_9BACT|nr:MAG: hypothetical protein C3F09_12885 [candidate division GN15 bacterium]